jgi:hypothetical protein
LSPRTFSRFDKCSLNFQISHFGPLNFQFLLLWTPLLVFNVKLKRFDFLCSLYPHPVHLKFRKYPKTTAPTPAQNDVILGIKIIYLFLKKAKWPLGVVRPHPKAPPPTPKKRNQFMEWVMGFWRWFRPSYTGPWGWSGHPQKPKTHSVNGFFFFFFWPFGGGQTTPLAMGVALTTPIFFSSLFYFILFFFNF